MQQEDPKVSTEESCWCAATSMWKKRAKEKEVGRDRFDCHNPSCFSETRLATMRAKSNEERHDPPSMSNNYSMSLNGLNLALTPKHHVEKKRCPRLA
jgi:hypothetical protein